MKVDWLPISVLAGGMATMALVAYAKHWLVIRARTGPKAQPTDTSCPDGVSEATWNVTVRQFQWQIGHRGFPVSAADDLAGVYGTMGEDTEDTIEDILKVFGVEFPKRVRPLRPILTVGDVARFVEFCVVAKRRERGD
jgi:hypothetical protein